MTFCVNYENFKSVFALPNAVVDDHIRLCGGQSLKVLLCILRHPEQPIDPVQIGAILAIAPEDVKDALVYWVQAGVLLKTDEPSPVQPIAATPAVPPAPKETQPLPCVELVAATGQKVATLSSRPRISTHDINQMAKADPSIEILINEAQSKMGRLLSPIETETLISLYTYAHLPVDYILMAVLYCVSIGKGNLRYIEKTIYSWLDKDIDTHEKAEIYIKQLSQNSQREREVKSAFGIFNRNLTARECGFITRWYSDFRYDIAMIKFAYEKTIDNIGNISFPYIDTILSNWFSKGYKNTKDASQELAPVTQPPSKKGELNSGSSSYELSELEHLITYGSKNSK